MSGGFGDEAAEMADEPFETPRPSAPQEPSEVEAPLPEEGASAPASDDDQEGREDPADNEDQVDREDQEDQEDQEDLGGDDLTLTRIALEERTLDLQRLQAEYLNYKRRVDRDRELIKQNATYAALAPITEVLDTIDRAREHGPLDAGLKTIAEQLERTVAALGLVKFGEVGDAFDPTVHEALSHVGEDPDVSVTTCKVIAKSGYKFGDRVVRAAQVLVVDPGTPEP